MPPWHISLFTVSYFFSEVLITPSDGKIRNCFSFFFSRNSKRYHYWVVKSTHKIFKEFCKGLPIMVEQKRKFCFLQPLKRLFHHSVNTSLLEYSVEQCIFGKRICTTHPDKYHIRDMTQVYFLSSRICSVF